MGTIKTTNIEPIADNGTVTLGSSGDTITVPSGATINLSNATQTGVGGVNTPMILAVANTSQTVAELSNVKITNLNTQPINTGGTWDSSNHRWTPGVAGTYYLAGQTSINLNNGGSFLQAMIYKNGSIISYYQVVAEGTNATYTAKTTVIDTADTDDYYELFIKHNSGGNSTVNYDSAAKYTHFLGYKLI